MNSSAPASAVTVGTGPLGIDDVVAVARHGASVVLDAAALDGVAASRAIVEGLAADPEPHYGISTGFGALATTFIAEDRRAQLQASLVRSHAAGSGAEVETEVVRALMLLRLSTLMTGRTGVRRETAETYASILNAGITPVVREYGSLGCSGDLAPLAHCALVAMGEGEVRVGSVGRVASEITDAASALAAAGITPLRLAEKEGLALINGTDGMLGMLALAIDDLRMLLTTADIAAAMSVEGLMGTDAVFAEDLHRLRPQRGQAVSAANLRRLLAGSPIVASHKGPECTRVQDAYSLRCAPQVHGAVRDVVAYAEGVVGIELNAATDNPIVLAERGEVLSNGNFHGQPVAFALDTLKLALHELSSISERRIERMLNPALSNGLPPFLTADGGLNSGLMIAQYVAASLVSEGKVLVHPASADSIPTSAGQEDHVSMGATAAVHLWHVCANVERVLGIELLCGAQGLDFLTPKRPGPAVGAAHAAVREISPHLDADRSLAAEIEVLAGRIRDGSLLESVERGSAPLR
jgi:histidine ammonia-lyase